jgi:prepilin-type N-terminal cleavage/methylation domain-containing protein
MITPAAPTDTNRGFSMIELMVALTIASVMLLYGLPAFNDFTTQRRMAANGNALIAAMNYARSEATRLGGTVSLRAVNAGDSDNEWGPGFCVTPGTPANCNAAIANFTIDGAATLNAINGLNNQAMISYNSRGLILGGLTGSFQLCGSDADDDPGRVVNVNAIGRASVRELVCFP